MTRSRIALFVAAVALVGAPLFAGGHDCTGGDHAKQASAQHCPYNKNISKTAEMTTDGAVVTLVGKNKDAVEAIQGHLAMHKNGEPCEGCPLSMKEVTTEFAANDKGGVLTIHAATPDAVKQIQEWASSPASSCCGKGKDKAKA